jgi:group I intron endonuclease
MWKNNLNNKRYIGSSVDLKIRFQQYFNVNHLLSNTCMNICKALLKYDYFNFSLTILEYCSVSDLLIREKHYWGILKPEYNIAQDPTAPMSGRTHSDATKIIMSDAKKGENNKGENHPMYGKNHTEETKQKISDAVTGKNHSDESKKIMSDKKKEKIILCLDKIIPMNLKKNIRCYAK